MSFATMHMAMFQLFRGRLAQSNDPEIQEYVRSQMVDAYGEDQVAAWEANSNDIPGVFSKWF